MKAIASWSLHVFVWALLYLAWAGHVEALNALIVLVWIFAPLMVLVAFLFAHPDSAQQMIEHYQKQPLSIHYQVLMVLGAVQQAAVFVVLTYLGALVTAVAAFVWIVASSIVRAAVRAARAAAAKVSP